MIDNKTIREHIILNKLLPCEPGELTYIEAETAPDNTSITFTTNVVDDIKDLYVDIVPKQSGSGDPSPDNIRPITGTDNLKFSHGLIPATGPINVIDIPLGETVYGGYYNSVTGELWKTWSAPLLVDGSFSVNSVSQSGGTYFVSVVVNLTSENTTASNITVYSDKFVTRTGLGGGDNHCYITNNGKTLVCVLADQTITTKEQATQWFEDNPTNFVYKLATPVKVADITPVEIKSLIGKQKIQSTNKFSFSLKYPYMTGGSCNGIMKFLPIFYPCGKGVNHNGSTF